MTVAVYSPNGAIPNNDYSHRSAWVKMCLSELGEKEYVLQPKDDLGNYSKVYLYLGMEWTGQLNLFGGASAENAQKFFKLLQAKELVWLPMSTDPKCDLGKICSARSSEDPHWANADWDKLSKICLEAPVAVLPHRYSVVIGDSHALCLYKPHVLICRNDHKTLHGALKQGLQSFLPVQPVSEVLFCFGNIDVQHHLVRLPERASVEVGRDYALQARELALDLGIKVSLMRPLPMLPKDRKIATPGHYKGKPWHGTPEERFTRAKLMETTMEQVTAEEYKADVSLISWPDRFTKDTIYLDEAVMERPRGVHVAWANRRETWN